MKVIFPFVRFANCVASAYSTDSGLDRDYLGSVYMTKDTLAQRTLAERALRKNFRRRA